MLLTAVLSLFPAYGSAEAPFIRLATGSGPLEQSVCTGAPIEPIVLKYGGDGVTTIEQVQKHMVPEKGNTIQGWRNDGLGFNNNTGTRQCTIDGSISGTANWLSANLTGSVTYNITIRTVGGATNAEAIIQITVHPHLNEHQIKIVSTNCSEPANAAIVVMPGREPGTPPYKAKTSDMTDWVDITDVCYVPGMTFADGSPAFTGNLPAFYHIITNEAEVERIRNNWDISIMDSNGCISGDPLQPNNIPTVDELDGQDITYTGQEYFDSKEENCKISITVHSAAAWRFTDPGDPDNMAANYPIVYVLKKKNENSGIFEEIDRKWTTTNMAEITFPDLEAGIYAVSTAFYDNPGNPEDKPWSNCTYDIPYGEPNGSVYEKDIAITGTPEVFDLTAPDGNTYCDEGTGSGADLQLSGSETGISYQLYKNNSPVGNPLTGTGSAINFGKQTEGLYTVIATKSGCTVDMAGEITITKKDAPAAPVINIPNGGLSYCKGTDGTEVIVTDADNGVTYTLYKVESDSETQVAQATATADGDLSLGKQTAGTYKVVATNDSQCSSEREDGSFSITELPLPAEMELSAPNGSGYCEGDAGVELQLPTSEAGIEYALEKDGAVIGTFTGTGSAIELGVYEAGEYIVIATNTITGCSVQSQSAFSVEIMGISAAPTVNTDYVEDGTFEICAGESQSITLTTLIENGDALNLTWYKDAQLTEIVPDDEIDVDLSNEKDVTYYVTNTETDKCPSAAVPVRILVKVNASVPSIDVVDADGFAYNDCKKDGRFDLNNLVSSSQNDLAWFDSNMQTITDETFDMSVPGSTSYFVSAVSADGCQSTTVEVKVNIKDFATSADITADDMEVCTGASATLTAATSISDNDLVFTWYDDADLLNVVGTGATLQISGPEDSKTYYVTVKGANTCENEAGNAAEVEVSGIRPISEVTLEPAEESIGMGEETTKTLNVEPYGAYYTSAWTANGNPIEDIDGYFPAKPYTDQLYKVVVTDECGNTIEAAAVTKVIWPTIFTPHNNDGYNDGFLVGMAEDIHLEIYDRWGNVVYRGNDGWHQSEAAQKMPGVYYYIATLPDGSIKKGTVEIYK